MSNIKIIVITGQTATGKTKLAVDYLKKYDGELVNCDSRQVYKYLNIITGKDIDSVHLYDIVDPKDYFSSFDYKEKAIPVVEDILKRKKSPIIVGGTYLYLKHLLYGVETEKIPPDWDLRKKLNLKNVGELQELLQKKNSKLYENLNNSDKNNPQRLIRKLEIASSPPRQLDRLNSGRHDILNRPLKEVIFIGLRYSNKEKLGKAITERVRQRLEAGAIVEVEDLIKKGYNQNDPGLQTIGYQQVINYLKGAYSKEQMIAEWINKEMQYAKRQYTFMKKDKNIKWIEV